MKGFWMRLKKAMAELNENNDGVGIVEVILILVDIYSELYKCILGFSCIKC